MTAVFPYDPDWSSDVKERVEYLTRSVVSRVGMEQRIRLRAIPRRRLEFNLALLGGENEPFETFLWARQSEQLFVPWWPDAIRHVGTLSASATSIPVATANRLFALSKYVAIWTSPTTCEVQTVSAVGANSITCAALSASYTNPVIAPVFLGRLEPSQDVEAVSSSSFSGTVKLACEVGATDPAPSPSALSQVYGYDILQVVPDWRGVRVGSRRSVSTLDSGIGPITVLDRGSISFQEIVFPWFMSSRAEIQEFRNFVDRRVGSLSPFWVPSWRVDLTTNASAASNASAISIRACGYSSQAFPFTARKYLAIRTPTGGWIYRKVTSASAAGASETLGLDSQLGVALPSGAQISYLLLCRMGNDSAEIEWKSSSAGTAKTRFVELPREVPA